MQQASPRGACYILGQNAFELNQETTHNDRRSQRLHILFLSGWVLLNLIHGASTDLSNDEAYYWMYSEFLDWGYFHQPPMIGVFIKLGYSLIGGELGVRLVSILANALVVHLIYKMTKGTNPLLYWSIVSSVLLVHIGGFFAVPDSPLMFFSVLFLYVFDRYTLANNWKNTLWLMLICPALLYSKYHGILVLGMVALVNPWLWKRGSFYLILSSTIILLLPHFWWQYSHDFPGFGYHLSGRFGDNFNLEHILNYPLGQLVIAGPLISIPLFIWGFKATRSTNFDRTLFWLMCGIFGFFFIWSFKGPIEANWSATGFIPLFILAYKAAEKHVARQRWVFRLAIPSVLLLMLLRAQFIFAFFQTDLAFDRTSEFNGWPEFAAEVKAVAGERRVVANSYQMASKLSFYLNQKVPSMNIFTKGNEYDLWLLDRELVGEDVVFINDFNYAVPVDSVRSPKGTWLNAVQIDAFYPWNGVDLIADQEEVHCKAGAQFTLNISFENPYGFSEKLASKVHYTRLSYHLRKEGEIVVWDGLRTLIEHDDKEQMTIQAPTEPGTYTIEVAAVTFEYAGWWNPKSFVTLVVE